MAGAMVVSVWDDDQVVGDEPPAELAVQLWAETARELIGPSATATVSIDCDDPDTEMRLKVAGYQVGEIDADEGQDEETVVVEREGPLAELLDPVLRLPTEAPLGALAVAEGKGVDLDFGAGLDVWGPGALAALRRAAERVGVTLEERPAEE
jgi:hypothetical protein